METFDYVIVGAGSAGCVLANRLSEDLKTSVCVLEAGPRDWHPYIHLPAGFIKTFHMKGINWAYQQEPGPWTGGRSIYAPRGKTLGGSSSINGHIYNRGQRQDFNTWAQLGNRGWGYPDVLPYFKRLERRVGEGEDTFRGRDGGLTVTTMDWKDPLCEAFMAGAVSLGIPRNPDYNGAIQEGVSYAQRTIANGLRVSAATAFLNPAMKRPNVHVRTHAHATEIILDGKRAIGVRYARTYCSRSASRCATLCPASARDCRTITRRARWRASRTSRPSTNGGAASISRWKRSNGPRHGAACSRCRRPWCIASGTPARAPKAPTCN
jgi:choline dehydrogenase